MVKKYKFILFGALCLLGIFFFTYLKKNKSTQFDLIVYSYSSFSDSWGPGPIIKKKFEELCHCKMELRSAEDSRLLIQRVQLEGSSKGADVLVGINQWDVNKAYEQLGFKSVVWPETLEFKNNEIDGALGAKGQLLPFDWGLLAFNTKKGSVVESSKNLEDFLKALSSKSLALQDPRTSSPGLNFFFWIVQVLGEEKAFHYLDLLKEKIYNITSGWSTSYGLFQKGQAQSVFSYVTSPLYHQIEEKNTDYLALAFDEGQPMHIELMGVLPQCQHCERAQEFVRFMLTPEIQKVLMEKNYMFPVNKAVTQSTPWDLVFRYKMVPRPQWTPEYQKHLLDRWTTWSQSQ